MNDLLIFVPPGHDDIELARCVSGGYIPRPGDELLIELTVLKDGTDPRAFDNAYFRVISIMPCLKNIAKIEDWMRYVWAHPENNLYIRVEATNQETRTYIDRLIAEDAND